jgi:hypothetical protein
MEKRVSLSLALLAAASLADAAGLRDSVFESRYREAQAHLSTAEGTQFDGALAHEFDSLLVRASVDACVQGSPGAPALHGYFEFLAPTAYQVELRPAGPFAACMEHALENRHLPEPPRLPWRNPFTFTPTADQGGG